MTQKPHTPAVKVKLRKLDGILSVAWALLLLVGAGRTYAADRGAPSDAEFGRRLKTLADSGRLHDPEYVSKVLGLQFVLDKRFPPDTYPCPGGGGDFQTVTARYIARKDGWYRTTPRARKTLLANSGQDMKDYLSKHKLTTPSARLMIRRATPCGAGRPERIDAQLDLEALNAYACYFKSDADTMIGKTEHVLHTDGASGMDYLGWRSEDAGSVLTFDYYMGSHCAYTIRLMQEPGFGFLERRARIEFDICIGMAAKRYCAMPAAQRDPNQHRYQLEQCHGSIAGFAQHQSRTGLPPRPERQKLADSLPKRGRCPSPK